MTDFYGEALPMLTVLFLASDITSIIIFNTEQHTLQIKQTQQSGILHKT